MSNSTELIVIGRTTVQVEEDKWERLSLTMKATPETTLKEVIEWSIRNKIDQDTLQIHPITS